MIRKILVPVRGDGKGDNVLTHAAAIARRFEAHVVIAHCRARPEDLMPYGVPIPGYLKRQIIEQTTGVSDQEAEGLVAEAHALAEKLGLDMSGTPSQSGATASFVEERGRQVEVIRRHGRLADLICVAKPDVDRNLGTNTLKAALFHTGRPVLMCPDAKSVPDDMGSHIAIAWNGSTEAARAVALSLGLIEEASHVTVLTGGKQPDGASAEDLVEYLAIRNVTATIKRFEPSRRVGNDLLKLYDEVGANLLVMGAYSESHEKEAVFGGNTQTIVDRAERPVVLVH